MVYLKDIKCRRACCRAPVEFKSIRVLNSEPVYFVICSQCIEQTSGHWTLERAIATHLGVAHDAIYFEGQHLCIDMGWHRDPEEIGPR